MVASEDSGPKTRRRPASQPGSAQATANGGSVAGVATAGVVVEPSATPDQTESPRDGGLAFALLNDQPLILEEDDLLGTKHLAAEMASLLTDSLDRSPFVISIDAEWGRGKSSLLREVEKILAPPEKEPEKPLTPEQKAEKLPGNTRNSSRVIKTVNFNAWTADSDTVAERLVRTVLESVDPSVLRRAKRHMQGSGFPLLAMVRVLVGGAAALLRVSDTADYVWEQIFSQPRTGDEIRARLDDILAPKRHRRWTKWLRRVTGYDKRMAEYERKTIVVIIDDLDRCSGPTIIKICEAVKLYLNVQKLIFIMACDQGKLDDAAGPVGGRAYLEKIVQVAYQMSRPGDPELKALAEKMVADARAEPLIDPELRVVLGKLSEGNPRRVKRVINRCIVQYRLDRKDGEHSEKVTQDQKLTVVAVMISELFPTFLEWLMEDERPGEVDRIVRFLTYADLVRREADLKVDLNTFKAATGEVAAENVERAKKLAEEQEDLADQIKNYDAVPSGLKGYARNQSFVAILQHSQSYVIQSKEFEDAPGRKIRDLLSNRPLATVGGGTADVATPTMGYLVPTSVQPRDLVAIYGANFGQAGSPDSPILIGGTLVEYEDLKGWSPTKIVFRVGATAPDGRPWKSTQVVNVQVFVDGVPAGAGLPLTVSAPPVPRPPRTKSTSRTKSNALRPADAPDE